MAAIGEKFLKSSYQFLMVVGSIAHAIINPFTFYQALTIFLPIVAVGVLARQFMLFNEHSDTYILLNAVLEEIQNAPTRLLLAFHELFDSGNVINFIYQVSTVMVYNTIPIYLRIVIHYIYDRFLSEHLLDIRFVDLSTDDPISLSQLEGVYSTAHTEGSVVHLQKGSIITNPEGNLEIATPKTFTSENSTKVKLSHHRITIEAECLLYDQPLPEFMPNRMNNRMVGCGLGPVPWGHKGYKTGADIISGVLQRFGDHRIDKDQPILVWVRGFYEGKMPTHNVRYPLIKNFINTIAVELDCTTEQVKISDCEKYLKSYTDPKAECPEGIDYDLRKLESYTMNNFETLAETFFHDAEECIGLVTPCTTRELIENKPPRLKTKYLDALKLNGFDENQMDLVHEIPLELFRDGLGGEINETNIFTKDEKYGMKIDEELSPKFIEYVEHEFGLTPALCHRGIKHRVIAAEELNSRLDNNPEGQLKLCFYGASVKKKMKRVMEKIRVVEHQVTGEKSYVRFVFTTDTSGHNVTQEFREAREYALMGVSTFMIHGDDSLGIYITKDGIRYIECDYSSYDTSQADDAIRAEHSMYEYYCKGFPKTFIESSERQHYYPFAFKFGKEFGYTNDIYKFTVHLEEAMRHSGGWNTTIGNSLVSMFSIYYVLMTQEFKGNEPQFNTFADLQINVKPSAFSISENPHMVSYLKMGLVDSSSGWTFVVLPSRLLRIGMILSRLEPQDGFSREMFEEIRAECLYGYQLPCDFPVLGRFSRYVYLRRYPALALKAYFSGLTDFATPESILAEGLRKRAAANGGIEYTFATRFGTGPAVERDDVIRMMVDRYGTDESEILSLERKLTALLNSRTLIIFDQLAKKLLNIDYGVDVDSFVLDGHDW